MKNRFIVFLGLCLGTSLATVAQTWTAPQVPGESIEDLKSSDVVYIYNVEADAFVMYGMTSNAQACAARLTNGDYTASIPNQSTVIASDGKVRMRNKEKGGSYYISCPSEAAYDVVINKSTNQYFTYTETAEGSRVYTLSNDKFGKLLDVSWTYGGHLTLAEGSGQTKWAFIKESNVTNGAYALYKAKKAMYNVYKAVADAGKEGAYQAAIATALEAYSASNATVESVAKASRELFKAVCVDLTEPIEVSFMLDNADMVGNASAAKWHNGSPAFGWEEFEVYHSAFTLEQDNVLPLGTYDLGLHSLYREDGSGTAPTLTVKTGKGSYSGKTPLMGTIDYAVTNTTNNNWTTVNGKIQPNGMQSCGQALAHGDAMAWAKDIVVDAEGAINIKYAVTANAQWVNWQGFRLIYKGLSKEELAGSLKATIDEATALYGEGSGEGAAALKAAIDEAQTVYDDADATNTDVKRQIDALVLAMKNYRYGNASEENPIDMTSIIVNPSFEKKLEGWTVANFVTQTNSSFKQKKGTTYLEKWTGKGGKVGDASVSQKIEGLDLGIYKLVAGAQNIQEDTPNASQSGAWIFANNTKAAVDKTAEYSLVFTNIESSATIGFMAQGATGNWLSADNFRLYYIGGTDADYKAALQGYYDAAAAIADKKMHSAAKDALDAKMADALAELGKSATEGYIKVSTPLREATDEANRSIAAYAELLAAIEKAETQYGDGAGEGAEEYLAAINAAKAAYADGATSYADLANHIVLLDEAAFAFMLQSPTGAIPIITKTDKRYARGSVMAFGRFTYNINGAKLREAGFCFSTEKNPTVLDQRSTRYFENNGRIYIMENMKPSTVYYARPYVVTEGYQVVYGDQIKIVTIPKGTMTWSWNYGGNAEENDRIVAAMSYGMEIWNNFMSLGGFHLTGNYGSGTPTADCSYGGWMRIGPNASYQRTGTIMHEAAHGVGVGTHWTWGTILQGGWTGPRANAVLQFWDNNTTSTMAGDGMHMWPYGINGAHEDNGSEQLYFANALIIQGMHEDGLQPTDGTFASPAYTFEHDDEVKYYIKNESASFGLTTSYLTVSGTSLKWKEATSVDVANDDNFAWYLSFDPVKQYYMFRNAGTGQYITYSNSTFKVATKTTPAATEKFHVMKGRKDIKVGSGTSATNVRGYWIMNVTNNNPRAMVATASGNVGATGFDLSADAASQHWVILTAEETLKFDEAARLSALNELKTLISNLNKVKSTPHTEDAEGADVAIDAALSYAQTVADDANAGLDLLRATIESTRQAGMDFLASATPASVDEPFDVTFLVTNASISDNTGWSLAPTFNFSCLEFYQATFDFNQTITGLPAGTYKTTVQAFQRPGAYATAYSDYVNGTNKVTTYLYANTESVKVAHIGTEARASKLGGTEAAVGSPVRYIPDNMEAASKYFARGLYENEIMTELAEGKHSLKIGLRCSSSSDGYWTIFDNFHLYYYGDMTKEHITGIDEVATGADNVPAAVYNLQGQKVGDSLEGLPRGIYIVNKKKVLLR